MQIVYGRLLRHCRGGSGAQNTRGKATQGRGAHEASIQGAGPQKGMGGVFHVEPRGGAGVYTMPWRVRQPARGPRLEVQHVLKLNHRAWDRAWRCFPSIAVIAGTVIGGGVFAQQQPPSNRPTRAAPPKAMPKVAPVAPAAPPVAQPGTPAAPKKQEPPKVGPYVTQEQARDITFTATVRVHLDNNTMKTSYRDPFDGRTVEMPAITPMKYNTIQFVFPIVPSTASSDLYMDELTGVLRINGQETDPEPTILEGYPGGVKLTRWDAGEGDKLNECRQVQLDIQEGMRCYNTVFDETSAIRVPWPKAYPADVMTSLKPQLYVEQGVDAAGRVRAYDDSVVTQALKAWLREEGIKDPAASTPVRVAKVLAGKVWTNIQVSGDGLTSSRTGELQGMQINPPAQTLESFRGTEQDVTVLMAALYKKAGLPTRTVIGYDINSSDAKFLQKGSKSNRLRSWVEFALYDEANNTINWVPVDVTRMRRTTNRPPSIDRPWAFFGTNDELGSVAVFALQFHPPTDVVSYGSPAFWGWFVTPAPAKNAEQVLRFVATTSSKRGGEPARDPKNNERQKKPPAVKRGY